MTPSCIDIDTLIAYFTQKISKKDREIIENHLSNCDHCLEILATTTQVLDDQTLSHWETVSETHAQATWNKITEKIQKIKDFYQWTKEQLPPLWINPSLEPALVSVRFEAETDTETISPTEHILIQREMNDLYTEMYIERSDEQLVSIKVRVLKNNQIAPHVCIFMERKGEGPSARALKQHYVSFNHLPFGQYRMFLEQDSEDKGEYTFEINEKGLYRS